MTKEQILARLQEHLQYFLDDFQSEYIGIFLYGSQNYGLADENSDIDSHIIFLPPEEDRERALSLERDLPDNERLSIYPLKAFYNGLMRGRGTLLEILYTEYYIINPKYQEWWNWLIEHREEIAHITEINWYRDIFSRTKDNMYRMVENMQLDSGMSEQLGYAQKPRYRCMLLAAMLEKYVNGAPYMDVLHPVEEYELLMKVKQGLCSQEEADKYAEEAVEKMNQLFADYSPAPDNLQLQRQLYKHFNKLLRE